MQIKNENGYLPNGNLPFGKFIYTNFAEKKEDCTFFGMAAKVVKDGRNYAPPVAIELRIINDRLFISNYLFFFKQNPSWRFISTGMILLFLNAIVEKAVL